MHRKDLSGSFQNPPKYPNLSNSHFAFLCPSPCAMPPPSTPYNPSLGASLMSSYFSPTPKGNHEAVGNPSTLEGYLSLPTTPARSVMSATELMEDGEKGMERLMERVERDGRM